MSIYGMKDASDLILVNKATGLVDLYIDYANATTSEWTSESVYATKKGANAIRWDGSRSGTLTVDTELFDFNLLTMVMGAEVTEGQTDIMQRAQGTLDSTRTIALGSGLNIDPATISVVKTKGANDPEHDGVPLFNASAAKNNLPRQVVGLAVTYNDTSARIDFSAVNGATAYEVYRDGSKIAETELNQYTDNGLTPATQYVYVVAAKNAYGTGAQSAAVTLTTSAAGEKTTTTATSTSQERIKAADNVGQVATPQDGEVTYTYSAGNVTLSENAVPGDTYAIYYLEKANGRTISIKSDKFAGSYEIFATAQIREQETGRDELVQIHYFNAKPQSNFTLTQDATAPASLSIVFDLLPSGNDLAEFKVVK